MGPTLVGAVVLGVLIFYLVLSLHLIGPTEVGLVSKRFGKKLGGGHIIAFDREAGYQSDLLMPGLRFKPWLVYSVKKYPWVQVPADGIGVLIAVMALSYLDAQCSYASNEIAINWNASIAYLSAAIDAVYAARRTLTP